MEELVKEIKKLEVLLDNNLGMLKDKVDYIISNKISDKKEIEFTLDNILDLVYWYGENIKELYYSLLEYYKTINLNNVRDYENIYLDIIEGCDDND